VRQRETYASRFAARISIAGLNPLGRGASEPRPRIRKSAIMHNIILIYNNLLEQ